jgi:predicted nucleic-acid-binding protein
MIAVDTNVLVRLFANDDPVQSPRAAQLFAKEDIFVSKSVMLETEWVLRFSYALSRTAIVAAFDKLLSTSSVAVEGVEAVQAAIAAYASGMDFADALHLSSSGGAERFLTFDRKLARAAARAKVSPSVQLA